MARAGDVPEYDEGASPKLREVFVSSAGPKVPRAVRAAMPREDVANEGLSELVLTVDE